MRGLKVYRKAAIRIHNNKCGACCTSIALYMFDDIYMYDNPRFLNSHEYILFKEMFCHINSVGIDDNWWDYYDSQSRVWAMLFMEQIWKDEHGN